MISTKYEVIDECGCVLATGMSLEMTFAFITGFTMKFFSERLNLTIRELEEAVTNEEQPS